MTVPGQTTPSDTAGPAASAAQAVVDGPAAAAAPVAAAGGRHALLVATGIFLSRIAGLVRQRVFAHYFGQSDAGDAFNAAFKIPNVLQNLFGEGVLSASFIPVYSNLLARGEHAEARRVASVVGCLLAAVTSVLVLIGVLVTPVLVDVIAPGFEGDKRDLTIVLVRILFPGTGLLVLSAWCLGILNSHRQFFLSYTAPVLWSIAMIAGMLIFGARRDQQGLAVALAWASIAGSILQLAIQVPPVLRVAGGLRPSLDLASTGARTVVRNFAPVFVGRGVVQISSYVDSILASFLPSGAVTALANAQTLYTLPVSLFGMAVSASELPAMSSVIGAKDEVAAGLRLRLQRGLRRIAFFIVPSAMALVALGDVIAAALFQTGRFSHADAIWVWGILAGSSVGLLATTLGRLYASTYYALHDTRTPLRYATLRVLLTTSLGYLFSIPLPPLLGIDPKWGVAGLTVSAGLAGWVEFALLRRTLHARIGTVAMSRSYLASLWGAGIVAAALGWTAKSVGASLAPIPLAMIVLAPYGVAYFGVTFALGVEESRAIVGRLGGRIGSLARRGR